MPCTARSTNSATSGEVQYPKWADRADRYWFSRVDSCKNKRQMESF